MKNSGKILLRQCCITNDPKTTGKTWSKNFPWEENDQISKQFNKLGIYKWVAPIIAERAGWCLFKSADNYLWKVLATVKAWGLEKSNHSNFKKGNEEDLGNYSLVSLTFLPRKVVDQLNLETFPNTWSAGR